MSIDLLDCKTVVLFSKSVLEGAKRWPGRYFHAKHVSSRRQWGVCPSPVSLSVFTLTPDLSLTARARIRLPPRVHVRIIYEKTKRKHTS